MTASDLPANPYVSFQDGKVAFHIDGKKYQYSMENLQRIYVTKTKPGFLNAIVGILLFIPETSYDLYIRTVEGKESKIRINRIQRFYIVRMIKLLRQSNPAI